MVSGKYLELIDRLLAKTKAYEIEWKKPLNRALIKFPFHIIR